MRKLGFVVLAAALGLCAGTARAQDDNAKKIVGVWELTKSASNELPIGATIEFTKDFKLSAIIKDEKGDIRLEGTYKIEKDKLTVKVKVSDQNLEDTLTIKRLTDEALEVEDKEKKVDVFKKKPK